MSTACTAISWQFEPKPTRSTAHISQTEPWDDVSQLLAAIVESSGDAIIGATLAGIITSWNTSAEQMFGYRASEAIGRPIAILHPVGDLEEQRMILENVRKGQSTSHYETVRRHKDGHELIVSLSISPIRDRHGNIAGASKIYRDITVQKQADRVLRNAEKLAVASRLAVSVAHEINNPLAALVNLHFLLRNEDLPDRAKRYLEAAERELSRITHITRQALGFYQENAPMQMVRPSEVLESALSILGDRLENKGIVVTKNYRDIPIFCRAGELRQVFVNLIGNALDAMPDGASLMLRSRQATQMRSAQSGIRVTIADGGSGISEETQRYLFEPFHTTRGAMRTGLGLWMCDQIIARHKGTIRLRTRDHGRPRGTAVAVFLPDSIPA